MSAKIGIRLAVLALLAAGSVVPVAGAFEIGLQPASVELEIAPGFEGRKVVTLANLNRDRPVSVSLSLADWTQNERGEIGFSAPGASGVSATGWVQVSASTLTLAPGQSKQVALTLAPPAGLGRTGDYRVALIATTVVPDDAGGWQKRQTASLFYLTAGNAVSRPEITASRLTVTETGAPAISLDLANSGNAHARLEGTIEVRGEGGEGYSVPVSDLIVLDGGVRRYIVPLGQPLPANPVIDVYLENVFAPQMADETEALAPYRVETETKLSSLSGPLGGQD